MFYRLKYLVALTAILGVTACGGGESNESSNSGGVSVYELGEMNESPTSEEECTSSGYYKDSQGEPNYISCD